MSGDVGWRDLGFARLDTDRAARTGDPEVVYGAGKSPQQTVLLLQALREAHPDRLALATRLDACSPRSHPCGVRRRGRGGRRGTVCGRRSVAARPAGRVAVVAAGTSDRPVAAEAAFTARAFGADVTTVADVGVAGLHRLLDVRDGAGHRRLSGRRRGMEGALPSVVGGLTGVPLVAVPTSVGYGTSFEGLAALLAMLNSCAPGVVVVNIDNGFGAGVHAARVARRAAPTVAGSAP